MKFNRGIYYTEIRQINARLISEARLINGWEGLTTLEINQEIKSYLGEKIHDVVDQHDFTSTFDNALSVIYNSNNTENFDKDYGVGVLDDRQSLESGIRMISFLLMVSDMNDDLDELLEFPLLQEVKNEKI